MDPITIAMALAQFAPAITKWLTGSDKAADAAGAVVDIARQVTGLPAADQALNAIQADPALALQFKQAVLASEADLDKAFLADVQSARARDIEFIRAGTTNYRANAMAACAVFLVGVSLAVVIWQSPIDEFAKAVITLILGRALGWVEQIFSFEYGTTRANKTKDDTINNLTR